MQNFLKHIFLFFLLLLALTIAYEALMRRIPNDYAFKCRTLPLKAANTEVLLLGNSHTFFGVNPDYLCLPAFNAANGSQTPEVDAFLFDSNIEKMKRLKYVVWSLSYFTLFYQLEGSFNERLLKNYCIYCDYPSSKLQRHLECMHFRLPNSLITLGDYYAGGKSALRCNDAGFGLSRSNIPQDNLVESGKFSAHWQRVDSLKNHYAQNVQIMERIFDACRERGVQVILFTAPGWETYVSRLAPWQLNATLDYGENIHARFPNVRYFNYLNDPRFVQSDFNDADHLNGEGAKKLSLLLDEMLK